MGDLNNPSIFWRDNIEGHKQSRKFPQCTEGNLLQVTVEPKKRGDLLDLIITKKDGLIWHVNIKSSLCCSDNEMVEFKILKAGRRVKNKLTALNRRFLLISTIL